MRNAANPVNGFLPRIIELAGFLQPYAWHATAYSWPVTGPRELVHGEREFTGLPLQCTSL
jgi:hypothetical protein